MSSLNKYSVTSLGTWLFPAVFEALMVFLTRSLFSWPRKIPRHELDLEQTKYLCVSKIYVKATQATLNLQVPSASNSRD